MSETHDMISRIEKFCAERGISVTTFGRKAVNDGKFIQRLRNGGDITLTTARKVEQALARERA